MRQRKRARVTLVCLAAGALVTTAFIVSPSAQAASIFACKKKNGSIRIVSSRTKCKKGESRLVWNTQGPAGKNGANGRNGANGANGGNGANGANGKEGVAGSALAFAHVSAGGEVDPARSKNVTTANITHEGTGAYCFHGLPFTPKILVASLTNFTVGFTSVGVPPDVGTFCAAGVQARLETYNIKGEIADEAFEVIFD
jgi:hypothetical protein